MTSSKKTTPTHKTGALVRGAVAADELHLLTVFAKRLSKVLDSRGYAPIMAHRCNDLAHELTVSPAGVRKWLVGAGMPSPAMMKTIAEKLGVSLDWLFGVSVPSSQFAPDKGGKSMPMYSVAKSFGAGTVGVPKSSFNRNAILSVSNTQVLAWPESAHTFFVESWVESQATGVQRGDLLIAETALQRIADGQVYLVRTGKGTTFIRRATIELDDSVTFQTMEQDSKSNSYAPSKIAFARSFDEDGHNGTITILGRIIGMCRLKY
jgi:hypothetical protein